MSRGERSFSVVCPSQRSHQNLCIDTRLKTPSSCLQREPVTKTAYQSRHLPPERVWLKNSKPKSAGNKTLYPKISDLSIWEKNRDCRITSPFKQWLQSGSERKHKTPDPAAKLREEVIKNIKRYQDLAILNNDCGTEQVFWTPRMSRQGRLQPLLGRPRLAGPSINKCIGIQPRPRSLGTLPSPYFATRERLCSSRTITATRCSKPTMSIYSYKKVSEEEVITSPDTRVDRMVQERPSVSYSDDEQEQPRNDTFDVPDSGHDPSDSTENSNSRKYCYRVIHFAMYDPNSDDEDYPDLNQKMTVEIKQRLSSSDSAKHEALGNEIHATDVSRPED